jgi:hypothetical protein
MLTRIPTSAEFQASTNLKVVVSGKRNTDQALLRIDHLLDEYNAGESMSGSLAVASLGKLYYALDRWLQLADRQSPEVNTRRRPAVDELYKFVVKRLCDEVRVPVNLLPGWLTATFGRSMGDHGAEVDLRNRSADYISREQLVKFQLEFRGGIAFQQDFMHSSTTMVPANSENIRGDGAGNPIHEGFSGYIAGLTGEFYSSPHMVGTAQRGNGFFHSSYLGGQEVLCAGEIKIVRGVIEEINNDSGHYRPDLKNVVMAVEMLAMHGVDLKRLMVSGHGVTRANGVDFLRASGRIAVPLRPENPGNTPLSRHQQAATLTQHDQSKSAAAAFAQFKSHCSPVGRSRHSWQARDKCTECKKHSNFYDTFISAVSAQGGIDRVRVPVVAEAVV